MAAGNVGYTDTRSFSGSLLGDIARNLRDRTKKAAEMAREERAFAEEQAEKQDTSLDEAGIGRGYFFRRALGSNFGGDRIARTRGYFEQNPPMGRDPLGTIESRFRGGFDYGIPEEELKKSVSGRSTSKSPSGRSGGGTTNFVPSGGVSKDKPLPVKNRVLTAGMLSTFQRLESQLKGVVDRIGTGSSNPQTVLALENQKMLLGSVFTKTTNIVNSVKKAIDKQTKEIESIARNNQIDGKKDLAAAQASQEESIAEGQNASASNRGIRKKLKDQFKKFSRSGSRLRDILGPAGDLGGMGRAVRNPRAARRLMRMRANRALRRLPGGRFIGRAGQKLVETGGKVASRGFKPLTAMGGRLATRVGGKAIAKTAAKGVGKSLIKKVPLLGAVAGLAFGFERAMRGDFVGAMGEVASGVAGSFPGVGTAISTGIDAALIAKDVNEEMNKAKEEAPEFAEGGILPPGLGEITSKSENERRKRDIGAKPLDMNFWMKWHTREQKIDRNKAKLLRSITENASDDYIYKLGGVEAFIKGLKDVFEKIKNFIRSIPRRVTDAARSLFGFLNPFDDDLSNPGTWSDRGVREGMVDPADDSRFAADIESFKIMREEVYGVSSATKQQSGSFNLGIRELRGTSGGSSISKFADDNAYEDIHQSDAHKKGYGFDVPVSSHEQGLAVEKFWDERGYFTIFGTKDDSSGNHNHHVHVEIPLSKIDAFTRSFSDEEKVKLYAESNPAFSYVLRDPSKYQWNADLGIPELKPVQLSPAQEKERSKHSSAINTMFMAVANGTADQLLKSSAYQESLKSMDAMYATGIMPLANPNPVVIPNVVSGPGFTANQRNQLNMLYNIYLQSLQ